MWQVKPMRFFVIVFLPLYLLISKDYPLCGFIDVSFLFYGGNGFGSPQKGARVMLVVVYGSQHRLR